MFPLKDTQTTSRFALATYAVILVNIFVFVQQLIAYDMQSLVERFALIPSLVKWTDLGSLYPFVTNMYLHAGFIHIISNMWFLKIFGDNVEERLGSILFLFVYFLAGMVGNILQYVFSPSLSIPILGASGAVAGVLGAYLVFFPRHKIKTLIPVFGFLTMADIPAGVMLAYWFLTQLFSGVGSIALAQIGGVAWWAHIGGFATGWLVAKLVPRRKQVINFQESGE